MVGDGITTRQRSQPTLASPLAPAPRRDRAADVALMRGSLNGVADAIAISAATVRNIQQNLSARSQIPGIPIAAGGLSVLVGCSIQ
jgi:cation transport ATPase